MFLEDQYRLSAYSATEALFKAYLQLGITNTNLILRQKKLVSINTKLQITFIMGQLRLMVVTTKRQVIIYHWLGIYF
jgi:acyl-CoA hydrolase